VLACARLVAESKEHPNAMNIADLLLFTVKSGASDLHLSSGVQPMVRKDGEMVKIKAPVLDAPTVQSMIYDILAEEQRKIFEENHELDFSFSLSSAGARFRANIMVQYRGLAAVFRVIPTKILSFEALGCPPVLKELCQLERGLVLVTGPTGSGKSTTLAAMIDLINKTHQGHILTIEDPIEFVHEPLSCMVNHREVGPHTHSFARALKSALREDPDVILVGEMRDIETIGLALTAAETGHLVFGTLHTSSAPKTVDRIIDAFSAGEQAQVRAMLSTSLRAVVTQALLPKIGGGRVAVHEIMIGVPAVSNLIREGKIHQLPSALQAGAGVGMQTLDSALLKVVLEKKVEPEIAAGFASSPELFRKMYENALAERGATGAVTAQVGRRL
jgi:twitching motility protein PilT